MSKKAVSDCKFRLFQRKRHAKRLLKQVDGGVLIATRLVVSALESLRRLWA